MVKSVGNGFLLVGIALAIYSAGIFAHRTLARGALIEAQESIDLRGTSDEVLGGSPLKESAEPGDLEPIPTPDFEAWSAVRRRVFQRLSGQFPTPEAILELPTLSLSVPLLPGVSEKQLSIAAGRIENGKQYGSVGNVAIAAHRDSYFRRLGDLDIGDPIVVTTSSGRFQYRIRARFVVNPKDTFVLDDVPDQALITLVTCYPFYHVGPAPQRFVVQGVLAEAATF